jgi:ribonuclease BN (tRNA processing enzyme)
MRLTVLGSNGTYPTPQRPASGYLVTANERVALLDCGPGVFPAMLTRDVVPDVVVLSHVHGDHCLDLLSMFNYLRFDRPEHRSIPVLAPVGVMERLSAFAGAGPEHAFFDVFTPITAVPGESHALAGFTITFGAAVHPVPAVCTRIEVGTASITYSGDTGPGGDLDRLTTGSTALLCEATHQGEPPSDRYPYHLHAVEAARIAAAAGAGRLILTHVGPTLDPNRSVREAEREFEGSVDHAEPGLEIDL